MFFYLTIRLLCSEIQRTSENYNEEYESKDIILNNNQLEDDDLSSKEYEDKVEEYSDVIIKVSNSES